jgi:hypothetical protein
VQNLELLYMLTKRNLLHYTYELSWPIYGHHVFASFCL